MYYIYHIPNIKIGCSKQPEKRVKKQGYLNFEILESYEDKIIASHREIELQKKYGYKVDKTLYHQTTSTPTLEGIKKGGLNGELNKWRKENPEKYKIIQAISAKLGGKKQGPIQGQKNIESGLISNLGKKMSELNNKEQICPYCNIKSRGAGYHRWHGENCKSKV
jgi:hypothetical protein